MLAAGSLCLFCCLGLGRQLAGGRWEFEGFDGIGVIGAFVVACIGALAFGPINGLALVLALVLHDLGHLAALRALGRETVTLRMVPLSLVSSRAEAPDDDDARAFHALLGAGMSVGPLALAATAAATLPTGPAQQFLSALALSIGALGAFSLLPFRGLDGGEVLDRVARSLSPIVIHLAAATAASALVVIAWRALSPWPALLAVAGLATLAFAPARSGRPAMAPARANLAFLAYAATLAAHVAAVRIAVHGL